MDVKVDESNLTGFMANQKKHREFKNYIKNLLSTFMPEKYLAIYMSTEVKNVVERPPEKYGETDPDLRPSGVSEGGSPALGPFDIIRRAFMHQYVSTISLENLETLGDVVLNEVAVSIIVTNWPNLLNEAGYVADMKSYYTNNTNVAEYAKELGLIRWVVRTKDQGLSSKERADVFESFVGAIVMIGEFFIGEQVGMALARLFLQKFFVTRKWYPEDPDFYAAPHNLWNDFKTSLPLEDNQKPFINPKEPYTTRDDKGFWHLSFTLQDPESAGDNGEVKRRTNQSKVKFSAIARNKDDAKTELYQNLVAKLGITKANTAIQRAKKRNADPNLRVLMEDLNNWAQKESEDSGKAKRDFDVPAPKKRGGKTFILIREIKTEVINARHFGSRQLTYGKTVATGMGKDEPEALAEAIKNLKLKREFKAIPGTDESHIWNPNETDQPLTLEESRERRQREECSKCSECKAREEKKPLPKKFEQKKTPTQKSSRGGIGQ